MVYANKFHTSKGILTFSIYIFHFLAGRKLEKNPILCTQFAAELKQLFITVAAAFRFCEYAPIIK